jgi:mannose-1-phosphate guanylyltransferase
VPVAGVPLITRIIRWVASCGVRDLVLNLHSLPDTITRCVGDASELGVRVRYSWEVPLLGSAGGPRRMLDLVDADEILIVNGDTLIDVDISAMYAAHRDTGALVTMAVVEHKWPGRYGGVITDSRGIVHGFVPKGAAPIGYHFVGVQIVNREAFVDVPLDRASETVTGIYTRLASQRRGSIRAFLSHGMFWDVGTPADYLNACLAIGAAERVTAPQVGRNARIAPDAHITASVLWDDVTIESGAVVDRCVIADGVTIPAGSRFHDSSVIQQDGRLITQTIQS